jgi:hypothetical protein
MPAVCAMLRTRELVAESQRVRLDIPPSCRCSRVRAAVGDIELIETDQAIDLSAHRRRS